MMQDDRELHVVTGAFGYSGRYITEQLLRAGHRVRTLTNSPDREHPFGDRVEVRPFDFDHPDRLASSLEGARVLYNTYWVRFNYADFCYLQAVDNTRALFAAARRAEVCRVVHLTGRAPSDRVCWAAGWLSHRLASRKTPRGRTHHTRRNRGPHAGPSRHRIRASGPNEAISLGTRARGYPGQALRNGVGPPQNRRAAYANVK